MRDNQPVTEIEYEVSETVLIQTRTDPEGVITGVNQTFVEASGFAEDELIGQPHNIVRHPDMPSEVFADMWRTLKAGKLWEGVAKNRRKNGDYYWVKATVAPLRKDGKLLGYVSSRWRVSPEERTPFEEFYRDLKAGKDNGLRLLEGRIVPARSLEYRLATLDTKTKILIVATAVGVIIALLFALV